MSEVIELKTGPKNIFCEIAAELVKHIEKEPLSVTLVVEGTVKDPKVCIRYPGKKVVRRQLSTKRKGIAEWANLMDFLVVPYKENTPQLESDFTFEKLMKDFQENKRESSEFWSALISMYENNHYDGELPSLNGIEPKLFLLTLKWIWIQEDLNYKLTSSEINCPVKYVLLNKNGNRTSKGAGRAKFLAALILLRSHFDFDTVKKIIPLYK